MLGQRFENLRKKTSLEALTVRGGVGLGAAYGVEHLMRLVRNIILARLLAPEDFGLMAIVLATSSALDALTEIGVKEAVIQNPRGQEPAYLSGAWWLALLRASCIYLLAFAAAPWIARFYENPSLVSLVRVAFLSALFTGAISPRAYVAIKQMNFAHWIMINNLGGICGILTAIGAALVMRNVWALVIGFVAEGAARFLLSYIICPFRPKTGIDRDAWQGLFRYAFGMLGLPILTFIFLRSDIFVVGKLRSHAELGLYSMAATLAYTPCFLLNRLIKETTMPVFSKVQHDPARINQMLLRVTAMIAFLGLPAVFFVGLYGADLLRIVYGSPYAAVGVPFAIIFASALMSTSSEPIATVYFAIGRPELHRLFTGIRAMAMLVLIFPAVKYFGLIGGALAGLVAMGTGYGFQIMRIRQITGLDPRRYLAIFLRASVLSLSVVLAWFVTPRSAFVQPFPGIVLGVVGCLLAYALAVVLYLRPKAALSADSSSPQAF